MLLSRVAVVRPIFIFYCAMVALNKKNNRTKLMESKIAMYRCYWESALLPADAFNVHLPLNSLDEITDEVSYLGTQGIPNGLRHTQAKLPRGIFL